MKVLYIIFLILTISFVSAQNQKENGLNKDTIVSYTNINDSICFGPYYEQGIDSLIRFINRNGKDFPIYYGIKEAKARVYVKFDIDRNGFTLNPEVLRIRRVYYDELDKNIEKYITPEVWAQEIDSNFCKNEAIRLIQLLKFKPARRNNTNLYFRGYIMPLHVLYPVSSHD